MDSSANRTCFLTENVLLLTFPTSTSTFLTEFVFMPFHSLHDFLLHFSLIEGNKWKSNSWSNHTFVLQYQWYRLCGQLRKPGMLWWSTETVMWYWRHMWHLLRYMHRKVSDFAALDNFSCIVVLPTTKVQIGLCIYTVLSESVLFAPRNTKYSRLYGLRPNLRFSTCVEGKHVLHFIDSVYIKVSICLDCLANTLYRKK